MRKMVLVIAAVALAATACGGSEENSDPWGTNLTDDLPDCSEVWVVEETLPADYEGCMNGDVLEMVVLDNAGNIGYDDRFTAKRGGMIEEVR